MTAAQAAMLLAAAIMAMIAAYPMPEPERFKPSSIFIGNMVFAGLAIMFAFIAGSAA